MASAASMRATSPLVSIIPSASPIHTLRAVSTLNRARDGVKPSPTTIRPRSDARHERHPRQLLERLHALPRLLEGAPDGQGAVVRHEQGLGLADRAAHAVGQLFRRGLAV